MALLKNLRKNRGFTLIELMIVVVIIGILASVAIYGVFKYIANSKSSEARMFLGRITKDALVVFDGESMAGTVMTLGTTRGSSRKICKSVASGESVPAAATSIQGRKYQSGPAEWTTGDQDTGWFCLRSQLTQPQYYMYNYLASVSSPVASADTLSALANGDLDGDGSLSTFSMLGTVQSDSGGMVLTISPSVIEQAAEE